MGPNNKDQTEQNLLTAKPAWRSFFVYYTAILIFTFGPAVNPEAGLGQVSGIILSAILLGFVVFRQKTTFYRVTRAEILKEIRFSGKVFKKSTPQKDVTGIAVRRGAVHRLIGLGHLQFQSRTGKNDLWWYGVDNPFDLKKKLEQILRS